MRAFGFCGSCLNALASYSCQRHGKGHLGQEPGEPYTTSNKRVRPPEKGNLFRSGRVNSLLQIRSMDSRYNARGTARRMVTVQLRKVLNITWRDRVRNKQLYGNLLLVYQTTRALRMTGHCVRHPEPAVNNLARRSAYDLCGHAQQRQRTQIRSRNPGMC